MNYLKTLVLVVLGITFSSFIVSNFNNEPEAEFSKDFIFKIESEKLQATFFANFNDLFDEVDKVDVHHNVDVGYYYAVKGKKKNIVVTEYFKVSKFHIDNASFPNLSQIAENGPRKTYCHYNFRFQCVLYTSFPSIRCGQLVGNNCVEW